MSSSNKTRKELVKALLLRPIDFEIYRQERVTGLTALLYMTPWSVSSFLLGVMIAACWWAGWLTK